MIIEKIWKILPWLAEALVFASKTTIEGACMLTLDGIDTQLTSKLTRSDIVKENGKVRYFLMLVNLIAMQSSCLKLEVEYRFRLAHSCLYIMVT